MPPRTLVPARIAAVVIVIALGLATWSAMAQRAASDRAIALQILQQLQPADAATAPAAAVAVREARRALGRADQARAANDEHNARLLESLGREWAELGRDTMRAVSAEADAALVQSATADASAQVLRTRAMLEELAARRARSLGELQQLRDTTDAGSHPFETLGVFVDHTDAGTRPSGDGATR